MPEELAAEMVATIRRRWHSEDQQWWRELLDVAPDEALLVARLAHEMGAYPVADPLEQPAMPLNPQLADRPRAGALRNAPDDARHLLARMHHDTDDEETRAA
jgi:hypothetical protein